jgi:hypothetical protein
MSYTTSTTAAQRLVGVGTGLAKVADDVEDVVNSPPPVGRQWGVCADRDRGLSKVLPS